jgi:hypothetical protein
VGDIVAQIYRSGSFGGDQVSGGDLREGQVDDLCGVGEEAQQRVDWGGVGGGRACADGGIGGGSGGRGYPRLGGDHIWNGCT